MRCGTLGLGPGAGGGSGCWRWEVGSVCKLGCRWAGRRRNGDGGAGGPGKGGAHPFAAGTVARATAAWQRAGSGGRPPKSRRRGAQSRARCPPSSLDAALSAREHPRSAPRLQTQGLALPRAGGVACVQRSVVTGSPREEKARSGAEMVPLVRSAGGSHQWLPIVVLGLCWFLSPGRFAAPGGDYPGATVDNLVVRKGDTAVLR